MSLGAVDCLHVMLLTILAARWSLSNAVGNNPFTGGGPGGVLVVPENDSVPSFNCQEIDGPNGQTYTCP